MEKTTQNIDALFSETGDYLETRAELFKLKLADKTSAVISTTASGLILGVIGVIFFTLISIGLSLWLGELTGKNYYGFLIVSGFYMLIALVVYSFRNKWLKVPISNIILRKLFK